jgi:hypothetical protein
MNESINRARRIASLGLYPSFRIFLDVSVQKLSVIILFHTMANQLIKIHITGKLYVQLYHVFAGIGTGLLPGFPGVKGS